MPDRDTLEGWVQTLTTDIERTDVRIRDLEAKVAELDGLREQRDIFSGLLDKAKEALRRLPEPKVRALPVVEPPAPQRSAFLWVGIQSILEAAGRAMTFDDIADALQAGGWPLSARNPREVVRVTMNRRPQYFQKLGPRTYGLTAWGQDQKRVTDDVESEKQAR